MRWQAIAIGCSALLGIGIAVWSSGGFTNRAGLVSIRDERGDADASLRARALSSDKGEHELPAQELGTVAGLATGSADSSLEAPATAAELSKLAGEALAAPVRVRVEIVLDEASAPVASLVPELLRHLPGGSVELLANGKSTRGVHPAVALAEAEAARRPLPLVRSAHEEFEVAVAGSYAGSWHAWVKVPGTLTWRALRGRGAEVWIDGTQPEVRLQITVKAEELVLDLELDAERAPMTNMTEKDG